jgi:hypothetical protein
VWSLLFECALQYKVERFIEQVADNPRAHKQFSASHEHRRQGAHDEVGGHGCDGE